MSTLAFSGEPSWSRRHGLRRLRPSTPPLDVSPVAAGVAVSSGPAASFADEASDVRRLPWLAVGGFILAVHTAVAWYLHAHPVKHPAIDIPAPPITVELSKPVEPPKPLPQKKEPPPPPPPVAKTQPPLPAVKLPDPPPAPTTPAPAAASSIPAAEAPPAPPPAPVAPPTPEPVTQPSAGAAYLHNPAPSYPDFAQEQGWEGRVILKVLVSPDGRAAKVVVKKPSGYKLLDESAQQAVQRWSFVPAKRGATPIEGWVDVPIDFKLSG